MAKIRTFKRLNIDDYPDAPQWFMTLLDDLNPMIDTLNYLLQNNLDIDNNLLAERQTVSLRHGVPITVKMQKLATTPRLVRVGYASGYVGTAAITNYNTDGTLQVTVYFQGTPPASAVSTILVFEP